MQFYIKNIWYREQEVVDCRKMFL